MPNAATPPSDWIWRAALIVAAVTIARIALLAFNRTDVFVDEAQYWFWGQSFDFGYYSKPPLIAWLIRLATEIGTSTPFWIRLPGPLCHAATAMILGAIAARISGSRAAVWTAGLWITLPMVSVGSTLASTDTVMMPWLALALLAWLRALDRGGDLRWAALAGLSLGIAFLGKYAASYYLICAPLAAALAWQGRTTARAAAVAALGFLIAVSPNVAWNIANGLATVQHTLDNADWVRDPGSRASLNVAGLAEFFVSQFIVFGPVLFAGFLWCCARAKSGQQRVLLGFSAPILGIVLVQALLSEAYANWAAATYLAGLLLVVPWLLARHRFWAWGTAALHGGFALALPLLTAFGTGWTVADDRLVLARYLGRVEMSDTLLDLAQAEALPLVSDNRDILADLFYTGRNRDVAVYARPRPGRPPNHYVQTQSLPAGIEGDLVYVTRRQRVPERCPGATRLAEIAPRQGAYRDQVYQVYRLDSACLHLPE